MDASGAAQLLLQCKALNEQRLFPSAAQLASLLVSANQQDPDAHATLGSALLGNGEHKRARNAFQNALDLLGAAADAPIVVELRSRIGECHAREGNFAAQLSVLAEIPAHARPAEVHMALGRLLQRMGCDLDAIASYKAAMAPPRPRPHRAGLRRAS